MRKLVFFLIFELTIRWIYDAFKKHKETNRTLVQEKRVAESGLANKKRASKKARSEGRTHA